MEQIINFLSQAQDAKISVERMNEIHQGVLKEDDEASVDILPEGKDLVFEKVSFQYTGPNSPVVLRNINLTIQAR